MTFINLYHKLILEHQNAILCSFQLSQHKPHLGLPRTWIISPKAMLKDPPSWDFRGRATTCHECTVFVKECFVLMAFPLKDMNSIK